MSNEFYGFEVQSNGQGVYWGVVQSHAEEAYEKSRGNTKFFKHNGQTKSVVKEKVAKYKDIMEAAFGSE